jgi:acyl carrier protein phosphodiesterase
VNWLAHVLLSESNVEFQLGNLLADLVKRRDRHGMSAAFVRGTQCHQTIDAFTDFHPVVHRSRGRIGEEYGRFAGILIDVFYDYFLASDWKRYCVEPLEQFAAQFYAAIQAHPMRLPEEAQAAICRMIADDRLGSYRTVEGVAATLRRVSQRLTARIGKSFALEHAISELTANEKELAADFAEFFPALQMAIESYLVKGEESQG